MHLSSYLYFEVASQDERLFQPLGKFMHLSKDILHSYLDIMVFKAHQNAQGHPESYVSVFGCLSIIEQTAKENCVLFCNGH